MPDTAATARHIEIPRLDNERAERYQARVLYVTMGPDRSLDAVGQKLGKSTALMERWSSRDTWTEHAARYDETVYTLAAQDAADAYRADLADYRRRYGEAGKGLFQTSIRLLDRVNRSIATVEIAGPGAIALAANALKTAADLEALALRIEHLLESMDAGNRPE